MTVTVIGLDGGPLPPGAEPALAGARVVVGAAHQLAAVAVPAGATVLGPGEVDRLADGSPAVLRGLPEPDAVFVGGGGPEVVRAAAWLAPRVVIALATLDRVGPCRAALREAGHQIDGVQLAASRFAELPDGSVRLAATNPVLLLWGRR